jgi:type IV secretory pathway TraG/TraD family ATPase VirD4
MQLRERALDLHTGAVNATEVPLRITVDASVVLLGLVGVLVYRRAGPVRLVCAPLIAWVLACCVALAATVVTRLIPVLSLSAGPKGIAIAEIGLCLLVGISAAARTPGVQAPLRVIRGTRIVAAGPARWSFRPTPALSFAGVPVPHADESKHFKVIGTTGTGKTTVIRTLLADARRRGDRAVIADPDGGYRRVLGDPRLGDITLNPLDPESASWDLFAEMDCAADAELLARALIPEQGGEDRAWRAYARVLLASLLRQMIHADDRDVRTLHRLVAYASAEELRELLDGTAAAAYVSNDNARFLASVRAIASSDLAVLEFVGSQRSAEPVAVRRWVRTGANQSCSSALFLPYRSSQLAALRGLVATWMRLAIFEAMDGEEGASPLWFVIDELDALGAIDSLKDALARLRKYGGRCVLGLQSVAQISGTYGPAAAQTIIENCANTLLLRCSAGENGGTARFASMLIGDREVLRDQTSRTRPAAFGRGDRSRSETLQRHIERAVLPAEIEQLADFHGYVKLASSPTWRQVIVDR